MTGLLPPGWRLASVAFGPRGFELRLDGPLSTVGIICELRELSRAWWGALGRAWLVERGETLVEHVPSPREHVHARAERSKRSTCFGCALDRLDSDDHAPRVVVERALGMTSREHIVRSLCARHRPLGALVDEVVLERAAKRGKGSSR